MAEFPNGSLSSREKGINDSNGNSPTYTPKYVQIPKIEKNVDNILNRGNNGSVYAETYDITSPSPKRSANSQKKKNYIDWISLLSEKNERFEIRYTTPVSEDKERNKTKSRPKKSEKENAYGIDYDKMLDELESDDLESDDTKDNMKKQENNDNTEFVKYDFIITNLRNEKLTNLCFIFNGNFPFFSGINKKLIKSLDIKESVIIKTHIVFPETIKSFSITLILNKQIYNYSIPIDN